MLLATSPIEGPTEGASHFADGCQPLLNGLGEDEALDLANLLVRLAKGTEPDC